MLSPPMTGAVNGVFESRRPAAGARIPWLAISDEYFWYFGRIFSVGGPRRDGESGGRSRGQFLVARRFFRLTREWAARLEADRGWRCPSIRRCRFSPRRINTGRRGADVERPGLGEAARAQARPNFDSRPSRKPRRCAGCLNEVIPGRNALDPDALRLQFQVAWAWPAMPPPVQRIAGPP